MPWWWLFCNILWPPLKPIAFSFVGNFSQTLQFMSGLLPSLGCFLGDINLCEASIASCFKVTSLSIFMDTVTIYFVMLISCNYTALWAVLSFLSYLILCFASEQVKLILSFWIAFNFIFPFPSVSSKCIVVQIIVTVLLELFYLVLFCLLLLPIRWENALLLYL